MELTCIIMAGGKSSRFDFNQVVDSSTPFHEKPLLTINGKCFIDHVIEAVSNTAQIDHTIIATSPLTKQTRNYLEGLNLENINILETPGQGYLTDLHYIIKSTQPQTVITISADIPLISTKLIEEVIQSYIHQGKPSLAVMAKLDSYLKSKLNPTEIFEIENINDKLVPVGINLIDCQYIDEPEIDQSIYLIHENEVIFNINTIEDYKLLQKKVQEML